MQTFTFVAQGSEGVHVNMVGNSFITGPDSLPDDAKGKRVFRQVDHEESMVYEHDNLMISRNGDRDTGDKITKILKRMDKPFDMPAVTMPQHGRSAHQCASTAAQLLPSTV